ncbi:hypothetical protein BSLA_02r0268 [Burkholderia stabilis]|nr:hypothetical protein BSLA_02r0268 [Burkholderia stabilis]
MLPAAATYPEIYWSVTARPWLRRECLECFVRPDAGRHYGSEPKRWKYRRAGVQRRPTTGRSAGRAVFRPRRNLCTRSRRVR